MAKVIQILGLPLGITLLLLSGSPSMGERENSLPTRSDIQTIAFCQLIREPKRYDGQLLRVRGIYSSGFERSVITAPDCPAPSTWFHVPPSYETCTSHKVQKQLENADWEQGLDIVVVGRLETEGHYGHLAEYPYRFVVSCIEKIQPLGHFRDLPEHKR